MTDFSGFKIPVSFQKKSENNVLDGSGSTRAAAFGGFKKSAVNGPSFGRTRASGNGGLSYADLDDPSGAPEKPKKPAFSFKKSVLSESGDVPNATKSSSDGYVVNASQFKFTRKAAVPPGISLPRKPTTSAQFAANSVKRAARVSRQRSSTNGTTEGEPMQSAAPTQISRPRMAMGGANNPFKLIRKTAQSNVRSERNTPTPPLIRENTPDNAERIAGVATFFKLRNQAPKHQPAVVDREDRNDRQNAFQPAKQIATGKKSEILNALRSLVGKNCFSDNDRYLLLDERDKLMYKLRELEPSQRAIGTCPDLCPEKERYTRIVQMKLSSYECDSTGRLMHARAIKEYARSAADQERPLPHELRPGPLLVKAFDYLLLEIVDSMPSRQELPSWYDFLWSRTRAIRKEITQQMLSDETAVMLVERCVRLHIYASYGLCTLDIGEFDQHTNTENLGKSLQTLRHLYEDLEKRGIHMDSEAEFRSYDIMMHLHDTNTLTQALSYRREVRESEPLRIALQLASALQNNNYVRFFRVLRQKASFLQCCICHRYFHKVRASAYETMVSAYQPPKSGAKVPLLSFAKQLGFDDELQFTTDSELYGLRVTADMLELSHNTFTTEPLDVPEYVQYKWIDAKLQERLSQMFAGGVSLQMPESVHLIDSFDENGCYSRDPVIADVLNKHGVATTISYDEQSSSSPMISTLGIQHAKREEYEKWCRNTVMDIIENEFPTQLLSLIETAISQELSRKIDEDIAKQQREAEAEILRKQQLAATERAEREQREREKRVYRETVSTISDELLDIAVDVILEENAAVEYQRSLRMYSQGVTEYMRYSFWDQFLEEVIDVQTQSIGAIMYDESVDELNSRLLVVRERLHSLWIRQFWDRWNTMVKVRKERRETGRKALENWKPRKMEFLESTAVPTPNTTPTDRRSLELRAMEGEIHAKVVMLRRRRRERIARWAFQKWRVYCRERVRRNAVLEGFINRKRTQPMYVIEQTPTKKEQPATKKAYSAYNSPLRLFGANTPHPQLMRKRRTSALLNMDMEDIYVDGGQSPKSSRTAPHSSACSPASTFSFAAPVLPPSLSISIDYTDNDVTLNGNGSILSDRELSYAREQIERIGWVPRMPSNNDGQKWKNENSGPNAADLISEPDQMVDVRSGISSLNDGIESMKAQVAAMLARCQ